MVLGEKFKKLLSIFLNFDENYELLFQKEKKKHNSYFAKNHYCKAKLFIRQVQFSFYISISRNGALNLLIRGKHTETQFLMSLMHLFLFLSLPLNSIIEFCLFRNNKRFRDWMRSLKNLISFCLGYNKLSLHPRLQRKISFIFLNGYFSE